MKRYDSLTKNEREALLSELLAEYKGYCERKLKLDLSRGKPNAEHLDESTALLEFPITREDCISESGVDMRNYGVLDGLPEMKALFAEILGIKEEYVFIGGNSSLQLMFDTLMRAMVFGVVGSERPWSQESGLKWICITPGYDRHFKITETLGFELISVKMNADGPDMDEVERLVKDPKVKGIWCVPKYSNPTGNTYSDEVVRRLARMECAAPDFRIMWDNAYCIHDLSEEGDKLLDIFAEAEKCGNVNRIFYFSSTSKITFPGDKDRVHAHMMKLAEHIGRKFKITLDAFSALSGLGIAEWTEPRGGYFISLDMLVGSAKRVYGLMKDAGVTLTDVGATFPYGRDPEDKNLRIAPTYPSDEDLTLATEILVLAVKIAALEALS